RREGRVPRGVEEGDALAVRQPHLIGADVLGDAAVLAPRHVGGAQGVQEAGLAVVDVAHDGDHRRTREQMVVHVLVADEADFDVALGDAAHGEAEFAGHQFGGVAVDHVVDLQHQALAHEELDDLDAAHGHPAGQLLHGDDVGDHHLAGTLGLLGAAALALLAFAFAGPADRGQGAHAFDGVLVVSGQRLDGEPAFAALGLALGARDRLGRRDLAAAAVGVLVEVGAAVEIEAARARRLARGALDLGTGRRRGGATAGAWRARTGGTAAFA